MGKKIDSFVLTVLIALVFYLYFFRCFENHIFALCASVFCCWIARKTCARLRTHIHSNDLFKKHRLKKLSSGIIMDLACDDHSAATEKIAALLEKYCNNTFEVALIQKHPSCKLDPNDIFELWKQYRGREKLVICATCPCSEEAKLQLRNYTNPQLALADSNALIQMIAEHPSDFMTETASVKARTYKQKRLSMHIFNRRNAPRCILFGFSSILMYIFSGNLLYLIASMSLFLLGLLSFKRAVRPVKLF